tara:strand:- start:10774 stop:11460 length:687 start_codon:yes stop_codon:yes gene_type:complete
MKIIIGIQARMSSKRFPGKVLAKASGNSILSILYKRISAVVPKKDIFILTSKKASDDVIEKYCNKFKINIFRGSLENVYDRYLNFSQMINCDGIVRLCADSPFIDPNLLLRMMKFFKNGKYDIVTNIFPKTFPSGQSIEIISVDVLKKIKKKSKDRHEREHVTKFFYNNSQTFRIFNFSCEYFHENIDISIDEEDDFKKFVSLNKHFGNKVISLPVSKILKYWQVMAD